MMMIPTALTLRMIFSGAGEGERGGGSYYNQGSSDHYGSPYDGSQHADSYGRGSADSYGRGSTDSYGRRTDDAYNRGGGGETYGGSRGNDYGYGYGAAGEDEGYPSNYHVVPMPGASRNCTGSGCCVPKCFAEKGSRVGLRRICCLNNFCMYVKH